MTTEIAEILMMQASLIRAQIRLAGMQAENVIRQTCGDAMAYNEKEFLKIIDEEGISCNQVIEATKSLY